MSGFQYFINAPAKIAQNSIGFYIGVPLKIALGASGGFLVIVYLDPVYIYWLPWYRLAFPLVLAPGDFLAVLIIAAYDLIISFPAYNVLIVMILILGFRDFRFQSVKPNFYILGHACLPLIPQGESSPGGSPSYPLL